MKAYLRQFVIILAILVLTTIALNYIGFRMWFSFVDAPVNPLSVNLFTLFSSIVCVLIALIVAGVIVRIKALENRKSGVIMLMAVVYSIALFYFYPIETPTDEPIGQIEIKIK